MTDSNPKAPIACDLTALNLEERERRRALAAKLQRAVAGRRELTDGYALKVDESKISFGELGDWMRLEGKCCPFLSFALAPEAGVLWLNLSGGAGVKDFLRTEMGV